MDSSDQKTYFKGQGFDIASLPGFTGPVVILDSEMVIELGRIWHAANARVAAQFQGQGFDALRNLCQVLEPLMKPYRQAMVEWAADQPILAEKTEIQRVMNELRKVLDDFDPDNWPGGKGKA